jgi:heterodisulfide reductase subunit C
MSATARLEPSRLDALAAELAGARISACLQCRKCTAGCPVAGRADLKPHELIRLLQLGQREEVLASRLIWDCTSCQTCVTRCPQRVDLASVNDALRRLSLAGGRTPAAGAAVTAFNDVFLGHVRRLGRMHEAGLMAAFKLRTGRFFADLGKLPVMIAKGKLAWWPKRMPGGKARAAMFERAAQMGGKKR